MSAQTAAAPTWNPAPQWAVDFVEQQHQKGIDKGGPPMSEHARVFAAKVLEDADRESAAEALVALSMLSSDEREAIMKRVFLDTYSVGEEAGKRTARDQLAKLTSTTA